MKAQSIIITLIPKFAPTNFGMESWCVDSELELDREDSTLKSLESTLIDFAMDSFVKYSKL
jgi:hypothetical protein